MMILASGGGVWPVRGDGASLLAAESATSVLRVPEEVSASSSGAQIERIDLQPAPCRACPGSLPASATTMERRASLRSPCSMMGLWRRDPARPLCDHPERAVASCAEVGCAAYGACGARAGSSGTLRLSRLEGVDHRGPCRRPAGRGNRGARRAPHADTRRAVLGLIHAGPWVSGPIPLALARFDLNGSVSRLITPTLRPRTVLGSGDGLPLYLEQLHQPREANAMALATDGSLLFAAGRGLRALVPPASPRPRVAITQDAFGAFPSGRPRYVTGTAGTVAAVVRQGTRQVATGRGAAAFPGEGELSLIPHHRQAATSSTSPSRRRPDR